MFSYANHNENGLKLVILNFCCPMNHDDVELSEFPSWQREPDIIFKYFFLYYWSIIFLLCNRKKRRKIPPFIRINGVVTSNSHVYWFQFNGIFNKLFL